MVPDVVVHFLPDHSAADAHHQTASDIVMTLPSKISRRKKETHEQFSVCSYHSEFALETWTSSFQVLAKLKMFASLRATKQSASRESHTSSLKTPSQWHLLSVFQVKSCSECQFPYSILKPKRIGSLTQIHRRRHLRTSKDQCVSTSGLSTLT